MELPMQTRSLRQILNDQITKYINTDNPKPQNIHFFTSLLDLGKEGRDRAASYRDNILPAIKEDNLYKEVLKHASSPYGEALGGSKKLRIRLLEGLCEYKNLHQEKIAKARSAAESAYRVSLAYAGPHGHSGSHEIYPILIIKELTKLLRNPQVYLASIHSDEDIELRPRKKVI
jgi:hypothetical protein